MKMIFLGTGTSHGIPMIGCDCAVCTSADVRNRRSRSSVYVEAAGQSILVDTTPDFRSQALASGLRHIDAVLFTHAHADHIFGFDDLRRFNALQGVAIPVFGSKETLDVVQRAFSYVNTEVPAGASMLHVEFREVEQAFSLGELSIEPLPVQHGKWRVLGYRFEASGKTLGYFPDCNGMSERVLQRLVGVDVMILDALRRREHPTHYNLDQSVAMLRQIGAKQSFITHLCHDLEHEETQKRLPETIHVPYDGQVLEW